MGEVVGQPNDFWTFDGINSYFPIELMIHQVENEYEYHSRFGKNLCERAWSLIESSESSPTGIWKAKVKDRYGDMTSCQWSTMKNDLLDAFGRSSLQPYSFQEKFDFLLSLTRGDEESVASYLSRVLWVMKIPLKTIPEPEEEESLWLKLVFLLGLPKSEQLYFLDKIGSNQEKLLLELVQEWREWKSDDKNVLPKMEESDQMETKEGLIEDDREDQVSIHDGFWLDFHEDDPPEDEEGFFDRDADHPDRDGINEKDKSSVLKVEVKKEETQKKRVRKPNTCNDICQVCGDKAEGHRYGALACGMCAQFFKRVLTKKTVTPCERQKDCDINKNTRKNCPECRLMKCLEAGMSANVNVNEDRPLSFLKRRWAHENGTANEPSNKKRAPIDDKKDKDSLCKICGDTCEGYKHYGVQCCENCRAFFRKSLSPDHSSYVCRRQNNCDVDGKNKCNACRLAKCKRLGMMRREDRAISVANLLGLNDNGLNNSGPSEQGLPETGDTSEMRDFSCPLCDFVHRTDKGTAFGNRTIRQHMKVHKFEGCFKCGIRKRMTLAEWDQHETEFHLGKCELCPYSFDELGAMRNHHMKNHRGKETRCTKCEMPQRYNNVKHKCADTEVRIKERSKRVKTTLKYQQLQKDKNLHCYLLKDGEDPKTFKTITSHLAKADKSGEMTFYCAYDREKFKTKRLLEKHTINVHSRKKYCCEVGCDYRVHSLDLAAAHMFFKHNTVVKGFQTFTCSKCAFQTIFEHKLVDHMKDFHPEDEDSLLCKICNKKYCSVRSLQQHIDKMHLNMLKHKCSYCDEKFLYNTGKIRHEAEVHEKHEPGTFTCSTCGATLKNKLSLDAHIKQTHEMPEAKCHICGFVCSNKYRLKTHISAVHLKEKKFECPRCPGKEFTKMGVLREHCMYHHLKIKPFVCAVCGAAYWQKLHMGAHIAETHEGWAKDKAKTDWKFLLRAKPELFKQIPIDHLVKEILGLKPNPNNKS